MQTVVVQVSYEIEIESGSPKECAKDLAERLDGYQPPGGDLDYQVTEARLVSAEKVD